MRPVSKDRLVLDEVERMLAMRIDSVIKVELLCLFFRNPSTVDTGHGLALRLGRDPGVVSAECEELVAAQYLRASGVGAARAFALRGDRSKLAVCERLVSLLRDRNLRLALMARLTKPPQPEEGR
jgi:hypothetical protein